MSKILMGLIISVCAPFVFAMVNLQPIAINLQDAARLQRGAKTYMNYCSGCHALRYMRYNRMAQDLGLTTFTGEIDTELLENNLIFTGAKPQDPIEISLPPESARQWFGRVPPDLSLSARERGPDWLYTYLKGFYIDSSRPFGANNLLMPDVMMPNILAPLQGTVIADKPTDGGLPEHVILLQAGRMTEHEFDSTLQDLVTFLVYVAEPAQLVRYRIGIGVILFLLVFLGFAYQLKRWYWRSVSH